MSLIKADIKAQIVALLKQASAQPAEQGIDYLSDGLSDVLIRAIQSAQVTIPTGVVIVVGSAVTQNNPAPIVVPNALS